MERRSWNTHRLRQELRSGQDIKFLGLVLGTYLIARQQVFIPNSSKPRARLEE